MEATIGVVPLAHGLCVGMALCVCGGGGAGGRNELPFCRERQLYGVARSRPLQCMLWTAQMLDAVIIFTARVHVRGWGMGGCWRLHCFGGCTVAWRARVGQNWQVLGKRHHRACLAQVSNHHGTACNSHARRVVVTRPSPAVIGPYRLHGSCPRLAETQRRSQQQTSPNQLPARWP